jgi:hypothetical protein
MTCDECFEAFSASVDGELPSHEQEAMNQHLDDCQDCQRLRTRLLSLSAEMKGQPFAEPGPEGVKALVETALAGVRTSRWGLLRQLVRAPYEHWLWRLGLRLASLGTVTALAALSSIVGWLLPCYSGAEAVSRSGLPDPQAWAAWTPSPAASLGASALVLLIGAWTCGLPGLLGDLWGEARLRPGQVASTMLGLVLLGPFAALPLLGQLELASYGLVCSLWTALCLIAGFALVAFKAPRPLPRLALDFIALMLPLAGLEWLARASMEWPGPAECRPTIAVLVASVPFASLAGAAGVLALAALLLGCGLLGWVPSYRGTGGRAASTLLLLGGLGCLGYGVVRAGALHPISPLRAQLSGQRQAYLLAASDENPWLLPSTAYAGLQVEVAGPGKDPRAARLRAASAYLEWDEPALLRALTSWADNAPGVAWGLSAFVDSLGYRNGPSLELPTEERQRTVGHLIAELRWRVLSGTVLSGATGSVSGAIEAANGPRQGLRLRLLSLPDGEHALAGALATLQEENRWAGELAASGSLETDLSLDKARSAVTGPQGEFLFPRVRPGRYVLALLSEQKASLTYNASLPGAIEVRDGPVRLAPIRLSMGSEGASLPLDSKSWRTTGTVELSIGRDGPVMRMQPGATATIIVDNETFHAGKARIKLLATEREGPAARPAGLLATIFSRDGRTIASAELPLPEAGLGELEISSGDRDGYLQIALLSGAGTLEVRGLRLEVLP